MGKLLLFLSLLSLVLLIIGSLLAPNASAMWLANSSLVFIIVRIILSIAVLSLLLTHPPRNIYLRIVTGTMAFGLMLVAMYLTYGGTLKILDGLSFAAAGISMGIASLEIGYDPQSLYKKIINRQQRLGTYK